MDYKLDPRRYDQSYLGDYLRSNSKRILAGIILSIIFFLTSSLLNYMVIIPSMPQTAALDYAQKILKQEYEKAAEGYIFEAQTPPVQKAHIIKSLENKYKDVKYIDVGQSIEQGGGKKETLTLNIVMEDQSAQEPITLINTQSSLLGLKKDWKVLFTFNIRNLNITGANGAKVYMDDIELGEIKDGVLTAQNIIEGMHYLRNEIPGVGQSDVAAVNIGKDTGIMGLNITLYPEFIKSIEKLINDFCLGWSEYCLTQDPEKVRMYLTARLFDSYTTGDDRFNGSKYELSECEVVFYDISLADSKNVYYTVDEKWHIKEVITDPKLTFEINHKQTLEQYQYMKWKYHIVNEMGIWKIDSAEQLSYTQEIVK